MSKSKQSALAPVVIRLRFLSQDNFAYTHPSATNFQIVRLLFSLWTAHLSNFAVVTWVVLYQGQNVQYLYLWRPAFTCMIWWLLHYIIYIFLQFPRNIFSSEIYNQKYIASSRYSKMNCAQQISILQAPFTVHSLPLQLRYFVTVDRRLRVHWPGSQSSLQRSDRKELAVQQRRIAKMVDELI